MDWETILEQHHNYLTVAENKVKVQADLRDKDLVGVDLSGVNLCFALFQGANLSKANLQGIELRGAFLENVNFSCADLTGADLRNAHHEGANFRYAKLDGILPHNLDDMIRAKMSILPDGDIIGWKKCRDNTLVKLLIPADARRSNAYGRKCRAEYAKVLEITGNRKACMSLHEGLIRYKVGDIVKPDYWDNDWHNPCGGGIHFFITRHEAEEYH